MSSVAQNVRSRTLWTRFLYMLLFGFIYGLAELVIFAVVLFQLGRALFFGAPNQRLCGFGYELGTFVGQVIRFVTYASEDKPFPFGAWPERQRVREPPVSSEPERSHG